MSRDDELGARIIADAARLRRQTDTGRVAARVFMATGRGGTGKSTFTALVSRFLEPPLLLLDIDPDQSLANMLGVSLEKERVTTEAGRVLPVRTLSDLTEELEDEDAFFEMGSGPVSMKIEVLLENFTCYRSDRFDLIAMGPRWAEGDYRVASFLFEFIIPSIGANYRNIAIDSPAGLEHLNRKVVSHVNDLFIVVDPSAKSLKHIERVRQITKAVGMTFDHLYVVGNHEFDGEAENLMRSSGEMYLGAMAHDPGVRECNLRGLSLWDLPMDSPACLTAKEILAKAG